MKRGGPNEVKWVPSSEGAFVVSRSSWYLRVVWNTNKH